MILKELSKYNLQNWQLHLSKMEASRFGNN